MPLTIQALQQLSRNECEPAGCGRELLDRFVGEQRSLLESNRVLDTFGRRERKEYNQAVAHRSKPHHWYERVENPVSSDFNPPPWTRSHHYPELTTSRKRTHEESFAANSSIIQPAEEGWLLPDDNHPRHGGEEQPPEKVDRRKTKDFQKRNRYKMRATTPARNLAPQPEKKKAKTASKKKDKKEGKGEAKIPKNRTDILGEQFSANNIANPRITLNPSHRLGIFKKGREAGNPRGAPDLSFNDLSFIRTKPQPSVAAYREPETAEHTTREPRPRSRIEQVCESSTSTLRVPRYSSGKPSEIPTNTSDVGPLDSISQIPIRLSSNDQDDDRSEYSRLGYQAAHLPGKFESVAVTMKTQDQNSVSEEVVQLPILLQERRSGGEKRAVAIPSSESRSEHIMRAPEKLPPRTSSSLPLRLPKGQSTSPLRQLLRICDRFDQEPGQESDVKMSLEPPIEAKNMSSPALNDGEKPPASTDWDDDSQDCERELDLLDGQEYVGPTGIEEVYNMPEQSYENTNYYPQNDAYTPYQMNYEDQSNRYAVSYDDTWDPEERRIDSYQTEDITAASEAIYRSINPQLITTVNRPDQEVYKNGSGQYGDENWETHTYPSHLTSSHPEGVYDVPGQFDGSMKNGWIQQGSEYIEIPSNDYVQPVIYSEDPSSEFYAPELNDGGLILENNNGYDPILMSGNIAVCGDEAEYGDGYQESEQNDGGIVYGRDLGRNLNGMLSGAAFKGFWRPNRLD